MNRSAWIGIAALAVAGVAGIGYWAGTRRAADPQTGPAQTAPGERTVLYYRNPMGLPDTSPVPKKDPMGMDYVPVYAGDAPEPDMPAGTVKISPYKIQVLGVRSEPVERRRITRRVRAVATVQANERLLYAVAPRFEGWIEKLHVNTTGQRVSRDQPLMDVYSPDLVTAQEEYLIALRGASELEGSGREAQDVMLRLADDALRRLRNWEISDQEIQLLRRDGKPRRVVTYRSAADGVVLRKPGVEGMRFMSGEVLYEIADLSSVWVLADVAEQDVGLIRAGQDASLTMVAYPGRVFSGRVTFVYPTVDAATRTAKARIELANPDGLLKPAMFASVEFVTEPADGEVLTVPDSAVLESGSRQLVLVRREEGTFEPRDVRLGVRGDGYAEVVEGLQSGEQVVVRANFLIDAESNLKSAIESFGAHGSHASPADVETSGPPAAKSEEHRGH
ncbi:MAG: efflux RND transporter periplasmic adaptor subunit [Gammaproteobacteria bacterium]